MAETVSNLPELSVSELSGALKRTLEDAFGQVRVRGEVSRVSRPGSGHLYFDLKDENAVISAVVWKGVAGRLGARPEQGLEVVATGRITTFPGQSKYQIVVEQLEPAGIGALMALLEARKKKLAAEGLFDAARKQLLPFLPEVIGIVTSPTGAVIRDMLHRLADRFPRRVIVWPVRVQGEGSAEEVAAAIRGFNALDGLGRIPRPDVLIVARGGGSLEDLWSFNEEIVARAAAESAIPLVSAIGHETDWSVLDLVADVRAPTPTAAAEMVVPVRAELLAQLRDRAARLASASNRLQERRRRDLATLSRALPAAERLLEGPRQRLDLAGLKGRNALVARLAGRRLALAELARRLGGQTPAARLARIGEQLNGLAARLPGLAARQTLRAGERLQALSARLATGFAMRLVLERRDQARRAAALQSLAPRLPAALAARLLRSRERLAAQSQLLASLNYTQVLARGFALVRAESGRPVRSASAIAAGDALVLEFADGRVAATAGSGGTEPPKRPISAPPRASKARSDQGSLF